MYDECNTPPYLDRKGIRIDRNTYERLRMDEAYCTVGYDVLPNGVVVSTVWLGVNIGFKEKPVIFETAISNDGGISYEPVARYSTEEEARKGHQDTVILYG